MGVQGLWELLAPIGRRVAVDSLGNKKLAVDASIWIIQFMKAMRDENGDMIRNAHLLGFFRRICKLLFLRIKPVFVFDGATPALKRKTLIARRRQRESAQLKIRKTAEKLLLNQIRTRKLEQIAVEMKSGAQKKAEDIPPTHSDGSVGPGGTKVKREVDETGGDAGFEEIAVDGTSKQIAADALLAASLDPGYLETKATEQDWVEPITEASDEEDDVEEIVIPNGKVLDPAVLASLPASMQLDLLVQMREKLVAENRQKFEKASKTPASFSQLQIQAYLKTVAFRREITEVQRAATGEGIDGVPTARIASTSDREFIFSNSFQGEKPAPSKIAMQRQHQRGSNGSKQEVSKSKALLLSAVTPSKKNATDSEGVVTLVSTEIKQESDANTSSVHTYVDDKGRVRVSRVRGMGVRMTRDLQWNLNLMKDKETQNVSDGVGSKSPIAMSIKFEESTDLGVQINSDVHAAEQGLQISFLDDGTTERKSEGDFFEDLVLTKDNDLCSTGISSYDVTVSEHGNVPGTDEEDELEWEEGVVDGSLDGSIMEEKPDSFQMPHVGMPTSVRESQGGEVWTVLQKEDGGHLKQATPKGNLGYGDVEDVEMAEAVRLSLKENAASKKLGDANDDVILGDGPSSEESDVEWEDGTGAVDVMDITSVPEDIDSAMTEADPSEEFEIQEAIRRSLEDLASRKASSALAIKESSSYGPHSSQVSERETSQLQLSREVESQETFLARERTRKGKARVEEGENFVDIQQSSYQTLTPKVETDKRRVRADQEQGETVEESLSGLDGPLCNAEQETREQETGFRAAKSVPVNDNDDVTDTSAEVVPNVEVLRVSPSHTFGAKAADDSGFLEREPVSQDVASPSHQTKNVSTGCENTIADGGSGKLTSVLSAECSVHPSLQFSEAELLKDAEETDCAKDQEDLLLKEAQLMAEREQLFREEEELQAELNAEREEMEALLDQERDRLAREEMELRALQKRNERNAESVTGEMFTDVQELLRMFGIPYVVAPMEAEAQCAFFDINNLVDGVVTEDSDVFLFGGRSIYKNLFDDRKYVETYYMQDLENEMGMNREKLIRMALLLGSDYTEGVSGIGIVNAIEVVNAFDDEDGLHKFRSWAESPDLSFFSNICEEGKAKPSKNGRTKAKATDGKNSQQKLSLEDNDLLQPEDASFTPRQRIFTREHRAISKNWRIPETFPSLPVIEAYVKPMVDRSNECFSFGRPELDTLRRFCSDKFGWNTEKADELLIPVLKEYDRREVQTRIDSYYLFSQRFAKIRSRRIQKAVTGITGKRQEELMDLHLNLVTARPSPKRQKRTSSDSVENQDESKTAKKRRRKNLDGTYPMDVKNEAENLDQAAGTETELSAVGIEGIARRGRGKGRGRIRRVESVDDIRDSDDDCGKISEGRNGKSQQGGRGRGRGRAGSRARGRGRGRGTVRNGSSESSEDVTEYESSQSDEITGKSNSVKRKAGGSSRVTRSSSRRLSDVQPAVGIAEDVIDVPGEVPGPYEFASEGRAVLTGTFASPAEASRRRNDIHEDQEDVRVVGNERTGPETFEMGLPSHLTLGGGFCVEEGDNSPGSTQPPGDVPGIEELESTVSEPPRENAETTVCRGDDHSSGSAVLGMNNDLSFAQNESGNSGLPSDQMRNGTGLIELGLRAMPLMRRKRRTSL